MDSGIHSALVGGALGGVLGGATTAWAVGRAQHLQGRHEARARLELAADQLDELDAAISDVLLLDVADADSGELSGLFRQAVTALRLLRRHAWALGLPRAAAVRRAADPLDNVTWSIELRRDQGQDTTQDERVALGVAISIVRHAVYGPEDRDAGPSPAALLWADEGASPEDLRHVEPTWRALIEDRWRRFRRRRLRRRNPMESGRQLAREQRALKAARRR